MRVATSASCSRVRATGSSLQILIIGSDLRSRRGRMGIDRVTRSMPRSGEAGLAVSGPPLDPSQARSGWSMATTVRQSIPEKSAGLHVNSARSLATAMAAIIRVVSSRRGLAARATQRSGDLAERPRRIGVERQRVEVRLGLLQVREPSCAFGLVRGDERTNRELGQRDRRDHRSIWKCRRLQARKQDHRAGVEQSRGVLGHLIDRLQTRVEGGIDVGAKRLAVHRGQASPTSE